MFSHGQLYVALSRCGEAAGVLIAAAHDALAEDPDFSKLTPEQQEPGNHTANVVYTEVFR